jgi:hypothetical protein
MLPLNMDNSIIKNEGTCNCGWKTSSDEDHFQDEEVDGRLI